MNLFVSTALENPFYYLSWILIVTFSICVHEFAHAFVALKRGDDTAALLGHLSLNPLKQMGLTSLIMLLLIGIAWGSVPVDPRRLRGDGNAALVAAAGPFANLLLAIIFSFLTVATGRWMDAEAITLFCLLAAQANGVLFLFNALPIPMLDGWTVFSLFIPALKSFNPQQIQNMAWFALMAVWLTPVGSFIWSGGTTVATSMVAGWSGTLAILGL